MEEVNKKSIFHIFLIIISFQAVSLLAISANFLFAQTWTPSSSATVEVVSPIANEKISGTISLSARAYLSDITQVSFYAVNDSTGSYYGITGNSAGSSTWTATEYISTWESGSYHIYAKGFNSAYNFDSTPYTSNGVPVVVDNSSTTGSATDITTGSLEIYFTNTPTYVLSGSQRFSAKTNRAVTSVKFKIVPNSGTYTAYPGIFVTGSDNEYYFEWPTASFANGTYTIEAIASDGTTTSYASIYNIEVLNDTAYSTTSTPLSVAFFNMPPSPVSGTTYIYAEVNQDVSFVEFKIISKTGATTTFSGISESSNPLRYYFVWPTENFTNEIHTIKATTSNGTSTNYTTHDIEVLNSSVSASATGALSFFFINMPPSPVSGTKTIYAESNQSITSAEFKIISLDTGVSTIFKGVPEVAGSSRYYFIWSTEKFTNGRYTIKGTAYNTAGTAYSTYDIEVLNGTTTNSSTSSTATNPVTITFASDLQLPMAGDKKITVYLNQEVDYVKFKIEGSKFAEFQALKADSTQYYIILHTLDFPNGAYNIVATAVKNLAPFEQRMSTKIENQTSTTQQYPVEPVPLLKPTDSAQQLYPTGQTYLSTAPTGSENVSAYLPYECKEKGLLTLQECENYLRMPWECREKNILDERQCQDYIFNMNMPIECQRAGITTQQECSKIVMISYMPIECQQANATSIEECDKIMNVQMNLTYECRNANITDVQECDAYMAQNFTPIECKTAGIISKEECDYFLREKYGNFSQMITINAPDLTNYNYAINPIMISNDYNYFPPECKNEGITDPKECENLMIYANLPIECKEKGIRTFEECDKLMISQNLPEECRNEGITNPDECESLMFKKFAPQECLAEGILNTQECENFMFKKTAPPDCKEAGILTPEACKKYMFEKYNGPENIPPEKFPIECQKANAKTADECEKIMQQSYLPGECKKEGITSAEECEILMQQKHMPQECKKEKAKSRSECDKIMFKKHAPGECIKAGIENEAECENFMFNKYAPKVKCEQLENWQCKNSIKERHLGNIVAKQVVYEKIKEKVVNTKKESINVEELEKELEQENEKMVPIKEKGLNMMVINAKEDMSLNENDDLTQTAPIVLLIDTDRDGLSDDMEKRFGTDPENPDSDNDGFNDGKEMADGYNPMGKGKLEKEIAPIEKAIIKKETLGQPKTEGDVSEEFFVNKVKNLVTEEKDENSGYVFSGKGTPESVVTLYVYSDLPLVITVETDKYGNWNYKLNKSLIDGEHEVYVAINDDTGKIKSKSNSINFFVKEAKAVSAKEFVSPVLEIENAKESEKSLTLYKIIAVLSMIIGILLFIIIVRNKKTNKAAPVE